MGMKWLLHRVFRHLLNPTLESLSRSVQRMHQQPIGFLADVLDFRPPEPLHQYLSEFQALEGGLNERVLSTRAAFPPNWRMEEASASVVYATVRALRPELVVETGVANGVSTYYILEALEKNGRGRLISIDISEEVGQLVPDSLKGRWRLVCLPRPVPTDLRQAFAELPAVDVFLHDSNHEYGWQRREYELAFARLSPRGIMLSDDIDWSYAFIDFVQSHRLRAFAMTDRRKVFGAILPARPPARSAGE